MSNYLAIATVTSVLKNRLQEIVNTNNIGNPTVGIGRPQPQIGAPQSGVGLYLYQTTLNSNSRYVNLPTRDPTGRLRQEPTISLDLHYLITLHGTELTPQLLLGHVLSRLHAQPFLTPEEIDRQISEPNSAVGASDLKAQPERIRLSPVPLGFEGMSKLWSSLGIPYELSITYVASAVLISADDGRLERLPLSPQVHS